MGIDVWMVTGDNRTTAETVAGDLDIPKDRIIASAMPADKVNKVLDLQKRGRVVAVVGDGINDSPALAQADLGVAVGAGSHIAGEAADMILIRNQLTDVVMALDLARVVFKRIKLNFVWALMYNVIAIPFAAGVWYPWTKMSVPPQYAGLAMALSSISVVISSLLLHMYRRVESSESRDSDAGGYSTRTKPKFRPFEVIRDSVSSNPLSKVGKGSTSQYDRLPDSDDVLDTIESAIAKVSKQTIPKRGNIQNSADEGDDDFNSLL